MNYVTETGMFCILVISAKGSLITESLKHFSGLALQNETWVVNRSANYAELCNFITKCDKHYYKEGQLRAITK